eukprot:358164-Chlamydomonas_euryale.AAC.10
MRGRALSPHCLPISLKALCWQLVPPSSSLSSFVADARWRLLAAASPLLLQMHAGACLQQPLLFCRKRPPASPSSWPLRSLLLHHA